MNKANTDADNEETQSNAHSTEDANHPTSGLQGIGEFDVPSDDIESESQIEVNDPTNELQQDVLNAHPRSLTPFFIVSILLVILDQTSKLWVKGFDWFGWKHTGMYIGQTTDVLGDFLRFTFVENPGMAFGIEFGPFKLGLSLFSVVITILLILYMRLLGRAHFAVQLGVTLLVAGAMGNLIDRCFYGVIFNSDPLFYGKVVDFINVNLPDFSFFGIHIQRFPWMFNVADSCVTCGIVCLLFVSGKIPTPSQLKEQGTNGTESKIPLKTLETAIIGSEVIPFSTGEPLVVKTDSATESSNEDSDFERDELEASSPPKQFETGNSSNSAESTSDSDLSVDSSSI